MQPFKDRFRALALLPILAVALVSCTDLVQAPVIPDDGPVYHTGADGVEGSHFRLNHVSWTKSGAQSAEFTFVYGTRTGFYFSSPPAVGSIWGFTDVRFYFGDGTSVQPWFTVTYVDAVNGWFEARATFTRTYAGTGPYTAYFENCCRLGATWTPWSHRNNPDRNARIETVVDFAVQSSARSTLPAMVTCPREAPCTFSVPAVATGGQTIRYRLASAAEMGGSVLVQPSGATIDPATGLYSWNTTGASLHSTLRNVFSTQVMMETLVGGQVVTKSGIDFMIEVTGTANAPPVFNSPTPADGHVFEVVEGNVLTFNVRASDPNAGDVVTLGALGLPAGASFPIPPAANPVQATFNWTAPAGTAGNSYAMNVLATDQLGASASRSFVINVVAVTNLPPVSVAAGPYSGVEGSPVSFDGSGSSDPDGDAITYAWNFGDGNTGTGATPTHTYADNGVYTVTLIVTDQHGETGQSATTATIANVAPSVGTLTGLPAAPIGAGTAVSLSVGFTDPGTLDAHTAVIDWGDGPAGVGTVAQGSGSGSVTGGHTYTAAGVYTVTLSVTDNDGATGSTTHQFVVVYDPAGGFVTGGGWIDVPAGSYVPDPAAAGPARFGFVSRYLPGRTRPDGQTQFQFRAGNIDFHSTAYDWLVVSGPRAQYKGTGMINRNDGYCFLLTAVDGDVNGGGGVDRFRLKIWDCQSGNVVFDNLMGRADGEDPTAITRGSVVIHR
jgi:PKD repeat protein